MCVHKGTNNKDHKDVYSLSFCGKITSTVHFYNGKKTNQKQGHKEATDLPLFSGLHRSCFQPVKDRGAAEGHAHKGIFVTTIKLQKVAHWPLACLLLA